MSSHIDECFQGNLRAARVIAMLSLTRYIIGVRHDGEPQGEHSDRRCPPCDDPSMHRVSVDFIPGKYEQIAGIECYVATPAGGYTKDKVILFLTDVFGIPFINNRVCTPFL